VFTPELRTEAEELVGRYPMSRSALLPLLHLVQAQDGHLSDDGIAECAELLDLTKAEVGAVATFYTMYKREPLGRHLVSVCTNFSCKVRGAQEVFAALSQRLGVGHNQTTEDGAITLEHAECLGNCDGAPVVTVDYLNYEALTPETATELVERIIAGDELPPPTRGFVPPGIRDIEHRLAGLGPSAGSPHPHTGMAGSQARATDGAVVVPEAGPGSDPGLVTLGALGAAAVTAPRDGGDGGGTDVGAEQTGPGSLEADSGEGASDDYPPDSDSEGVDGGAPPPAEQDQATPSADDPFDTGRAEGGDSGAPGHAQKAIPGQPGDDSAQTPGPPQSEETDRG